MELNQDNCYLKNILTGDIINASNNHYS
jgi:hypothetical protein